ncbi:MAG: hypothetical protein BJ554DRAFT_3436 [Olpidium bornovanus]|uniref:Gag1-like clamp domain-containing protein n=1 Tax=Olpidium bornovanus TaxID=278681 RepID=A0A8H7ZNI9_9FUNG|nr:MAG: hypothetical protein BJ554DRAFT_3436 [Olpidium bornovanus]
METPPSPGLANWEWRRAQWLRDSSPAVPDGRRASADNRCGRNGIHFEHLTAAQHLKIYEALVKLSRPLARPMPLSVAVQIIVAGHKAEGLWTPPPPALPAAGVARADGVGAPAAAASLRARAASAAGDAEAMAVRNSRT